MTRINGLALMASLFAFAGGCLPEAKPPTTPDDAWRDPGVRGRAIATASCASCHGSALTGDTTSGALAPSLAVVQEEYTWGQFDTLLCTGLTRDGQGTDGPMPTNDQFALTSGERRILYDYLTDYWKP